jgi:hypothetical protein
VDVCVEDFRWHFGDTNVVELMLEVCQDIRMGD